MNPLEEAIKKLMQSEIVMADRTCLGTIMEYNPRTNMATIQLIETSEIYENVPIDKSSGFIFGKNPEVGSCVILDFVRGDRAYPYVISILGEGPMDDSTGRTSIMSKVTTTIGRLFKESMY